MMRTSNLHHYLAARLLNDSPLKRDGCYARLLTIDVDADLKAASPRLAWAVLTS